MRPDNAINADGKYARAFGARVFAAGDGERWASQEAQMKTMCGLIAILLCGLSFAGPIEDARGAFARGDYAKAAELLAPLAEAGDPDALGNLGNMYAFGQGVERDLTRAASLWRRAADKGLGTAMGNLALLYQTGQGGLPEDRSLALSWFIKAAEHRHVPSMLNLSSLYAQGIGVEKDLVRALAWAGLAASNATNDDVKKVAEQQVRTLGAAATAADVKSAQELSDTMRETIDANVAKYKVQ
jgi:TPR repeat protein